MHVLRNGAGSRLNVLRYAMHVLSYGVESRNPSRCIKIGNACIKIWNRVFSAMCDFFRHCATVFGTVRCFRNFFSKYFPAALPAVRLRSLPHQLPSTRAESYYGADN